MRSGRLGPARGQGPNCLQLFRNGGSPTTVPVSPCRSCPVSGSVWGCTEATAVRGDPRPSTEGHRTLVSGVFVSFFREAKLIFERSFFLGFDKSLCAAG